MQHGLASWPRSMTFKINNVATELIVEESIQITATADGIKHGWYGTMDYQAKLSVECSSN
jgi:hypothetical protein